MAKSAADQTKETGGAAVSSGPVGFVASVLGGMHLGGFVKRIVGASAPPHIGGRRREEIRAAGVRINHGSYALPDIPGTARNEALYTSTNEKVIQWYREWVRAGRPALYPKAPTPDTMPPPNTGSVGVGALPNVPPFIANLPRTLPGFGSAAARILAPIIVAGLFWPSSTSATDTIYGHARPRPIPTPGGRTRGRRGTRARPRSRRRPKLPAPPIIGGLPRPAGGMAGSATRGLPRIRGVVIEDILLRGGVAPPLKLPEQTATSSAPSSSSSSIPYPSTAGQGAWPYPATSSPFPSSAPTTAPSATASPWAKIGQLVAPYLGTWLSPGTTFQPYRNVAPSPQPQLQPDPLTSLNTAALPFAATQAQTRDCSCAKTKKRKKKGCTNPVTKRSHTTRGGRKFVTVTRRIECQASSRKKPASARASRTTTFSAARPLSTFALPRL